MGYISTIPFIYANLDTTNIHVLNFQVAPVSHLSLKWYGVVHEP